MGGWVGMGQGWDMRDGVHGLADRFGGCNLAMYWQPMPLECRVEWSWAGRPGCTWAGVMCD